MENLTQPPGHADLVAALMELVTSSTSIVAELTRASDVADRAAALDFFRDALHELLVPTSMLLEPRDLAAATAVLEVVAGITGGSFNFAPGEVEAEVPRRDPRSAHRRSRRRRIPRKRGTLY
jgi:hypothetical protein